VGRRTWQTFICTIIVNCIGDTVFAFNRFGIFRFGVICVYYAKNMPSYQVCYLDILEYNSLWNESGRISELEDYFSIFPHFSDEHDRSAINILKNYNKDGWTPLSANPFGMGLNDIECDVKDGKCVKKFTFDRKIDKFKIIV